MKFYILTSYPIESISGPGTLLVDDLYYQFERSDIKIADSENIMHDMLSRNPELKFVYTISVEQLLPVFHR